MNKSLSKKKERKFFLGIDGGQSHTEAVIADEFGNILGNGFGGASNHAEIPGGRERLQKAISDSVSEALSKFTEEKFTDFRFEAAHCGMTGGADYKEEIIEKLLQTDNLTIGHDAPTALFGGTAGKAGIVVISGTGSVVYGENDEGEKARAGGLGFLFSDEGSGFWLAVQTIRLAIKEQDGIIENDGLENLVLDYFGVKKIRDLTTPFYNGKISREEIAGFAEIVQETAFQGNKTLKKEISAGAEYLAENVKSVARKLRFEKKFEVIGVGGVFRGKLMSDVFQQSLAEKVPSAIFMKPLFQPVIGALLLAYRSVKIELSEMLLKNLEKPRKR